MSVSKLGHPQNCGFPLGSFKCSPTSGYSGKKKRKKTRHPNQIPGTLPPLQLSNSLRSPSDPTAAPPVLALVQNYLEEAGE